MLRRSHHAAPPQCQAVAPIGREQGDVDRAGQPFRRLTRGLDSSERAGAAEVLRELVRRLDARVHR